MNKQSFESWLNKLAKAWTDRNPQAAAKLLADKFKYYETPLEKPLTTKKQIIDLWQAVPKLQKNIKSNFKILFVNKSFGIANFKVSLDRKDSKKKYMGDRIFLVSLNKKGLCVLFKQWREFKEK